MTPRQRAPQPPRAGRPAPAPIPLRAPARGRPRPTASHHQPPSLPSPPLPSPADGVEYNGTTYITSYSFEVPNAYLGADTFYFWRCFYVCAATGDVEQRSAASFSVVRRRMGLAWLGGWPAGMAACARPGRRLRAPFLSCLASLLLRSRTRKSATHHPPARRLARRRPRAPRPRPLPGRHLPALCRPALRPALRRRNRRRHPGRRQARPSLRRHLPASAPSAIHRPPQGLDRLRRFLPSPPALHLLPARPHQSPPALPHRHRRHLPALPRALRRRPARRPARPRRRRRRSSSGRLWPASTVSRRTR